jgi:alpha-glucosidase
MDNVRELISIRKSNNALINGGLRWIAAEKDFILYLRESNEQSILVFVSRSAVNVKIDLADLGLKVSKTLYGHTASGSKFAVKSKSAVQAIWEVTR